MYIHIFFYKNYLSHIFETLKIIFEKLPTKILTFSLKFNDISIFLIYCMMICQFLLFNII